MHSMDTCNRGPWTDEEMDDEPDFEDEESFDCGMTPDGPCTKAGSEECDWDCPFNHDD